MAPPRQDSLVRAVKVPLARKPFFGRSSMPDAPGRRSEVQGCYEDLTADLQHRTDPSAAGIERCREILAIEPEDRIVGAWMAHALAHLQAKRGDFDEARELIARAYAILEELDLPVELASAALEAWRVETFAGDLSRAEGELRRAHDMLVAVGERFVLCSITGLLGQTVYGLGRLDEAAQLAEESKELASEDSLDDQALWRCLRAKLLAQEGSFDEAESLVGEAIRMLEPTDAALFQFGAYLDLAEVQGLAGREPQRTESFARARRIAEAKGSKVLAGAVDALSTAPAESLPS